MKLNAHRITRLLLLLFVAGNMMADAFAQNTSFIVEPSDSRWTSVTPLSRNLLKVGDGTKVGVVDLQGREVLPMDYDSIFPMRGELAIATRKMGDYPVAFATVEASGKANCFAQGFLFMYEAFPYYSDKRLLVVKSRQRGGSIEPETDGQGRVRFGYADESGNLVVNYKYTYAMPFSEGLAMTDDWYITPNGSPCSRVVQGGIGCDAMTSFAGGEAVVSAQGDYYVVNSQLSVVSKFRGEPAVDSRGRLNGKGSDADIALAPMPEQNGSIRPWRNPKTSLWGYASEDKRLLVAPEFSEAHSPVGQLGIVRRGDRFGLVRLDGQGVKGISVKPTAEKICYASGKPVKCSFFIDLGKNVSLSGIQPQVRVANVADGKVTMQPTLTANGGYTFSFTPSRTLNGSSVSFQVGLQLADLQVADVMMSYVFQAMRPLTLSITFPNGLTANAQNVVPVYGVIHNPNPIEVTTTYHLSGSGLSFSERRGEITVPGNSSQRIRGHFVVPEANGGSVSVVFSSGNGGSHRVSETLRPYYSE